MDCPIWNPMLYDYKSWWNPIIDFSIPIVQVRTTEGKIQWQTGLEITIWDTLEDDTSNYNFKFRDRYEDIMKTHSNCDDIWELLKYKI